MVQTGGGEVQTQSDTAKYLQLERLSVVQLPHVEVKLSAQHTFVQRPWDQMLVFSPKDFVSTQQLSSSSFSMALQLRPTTGTLPLSAVHSEVHTALRHGTQHAELR